MAAKRTKSKADTTPPWIKSPVKPDHPIFAMINWMIAGKIQELNWERKYMVEQQVRMYGMDYNKANNLYDIPREPSDMTLEHALTSEERIEGIRGRNDYHLDHRCLESIAKAATDIIRLDNEINELVRWKIHLVGDVDFQAGPDMTRALRKAMEANIQRVADKKAREKEQERLGRERHKRYLQRVAEAKARGES